MSAMHIMNAVTKAAPKPASRSTASAPVEPARVGRKEPMARESESVREKDRTPDASRPEFSALLALLSGMGDQVRTDLVQQLPEEAASLVDRLLQGAGDGGTSETAPVLPGFAGQGTKLREETSATDDIPTAVLHEGTVNTGSADVIDLAAYTRARDQRAEPAPFAPAPLRRELPANERALEALERIASQRGTSLEQLLAVGDARGADARATIDALLSQAGTPAGARLAAQQLLRNTSALTLADSASGENRAFTMPGDARSNGLMTAAANAAEIAMRRASDRSALAGSATRGEDVSAPNKDLTAVAPELRGKVARVIERMKNEYGHDVTIVETARSQERQDWLFEQGRTRGGPVVTWTRDSAHTRGEAVDVVIDGSWDNAAGFARLQRIAREEGLRTLGMKDPGHLELAVRGGPIDAAAAATEKVDRQIPRTTPPAASSAGMAQVASVAGVAGVARVADTSGTARIVQSNSGNNGIGDSLAAYTAQQQAGRTSNDAGNGNGHAFGRGERDESGKPLNAGRHVGHDKRDASDATTAFGSLSSPTGSAATTGSERAASAGATSGTTQAERVSDIQQMRADAPAGPLSRMTLNVENANGSTETITVDVRGNTVNTQITTDAATAERIRLRSADLQDSLGRRGLESESLRVGASKPQDTVEISRTLAGERDGIKVNSSQQSSAHDGTNSNGQRERAPAREWNQEESRREQAARARDERQQQQQDRQERQRRATPFFGIE